MYANIWLISKLCANKWTLARFKIMLPINYSLTNPICKQYLAINNPQGLLCHKTQPNHSFANSWGSRQYTASIGLNERCPFYRENSFRLSVSSTNIFQNSMPIAKIQLVEVGFWSLFSPTSFVFRIRSLNLKQCLFPFTNLYQALLSTTPHLLF